MAEERIRRRLAAIVAADVVGFSRLMGVDEEGTLAALKSHRRELVEPAIDQHEGRIVKSAGDGMLVEFASVVDAVRCGVEIQRGMAVRNAGVPEGRQIAFRVGINLGDIIIDGEDIYGDGVNVAARLEAMAEPGSIWLSMSAREQLRGKLDLAFEDLGERTLKNIARPVRVFRLPPGQPAVGEAAASPAASERPAVAVLPFTNMSQDPEQEYFADGITEDIITDLAKVSGLLVIARNSAFTYKGRAVKIGDVCRELGVGHVVEGSVRKAGNRVRVTAQLIDGGTGGHLWAERYDRDLSDVFAVQDELTREIVRALKVQLTHDESIRIGRVETENLEAYDLLLHARQHFYRFTPDANATARKLTERALELAPDYAGAHAMLALVHCQVTGLGWTGDPLGQLALADKAASKAVALDPGLAPAHQAKGFVALWGRRHDEARTELAQALRLEPNDPSSHGFFAMLEAWGGDPAAGIRHAEISLRLDPLRTASLMGLGLAQYESGDLAAAAQTLRRGILRQPDFVPFSAYLAAALVALGDREGARQAVAHCQEVNPAMTQRRLRGFLPYRDPARLEKVLAALAEAGMPA